MFTHTRSKSADIRARVGHPIIDSDGHYGELFPVFRDYLVDYVRQVGGAELVREIEAASNDLYEHLVVHSAAGPIFPSRKWAMMSPEARRDTWTFHPGWAPPHRNTLDRATSYLPSLLYERMDDLGLDYAVLYPGSGLFFPHLQDAELRQVVCRALNCFNAELFRPFRDRMTPAAILPMYSPTEAIAELEYAVNKLGLKVGMIGHVIRPVPSVQRERPDLFPLLSRLDTFGLDSDFDYDPFWRRCVELKVPLAAHQPSYGVGHRRSLSNYLYNQTSNFAEAGELLCKSLFLGGVTRRFPDIRFQFLECGVGWATVLYAELVARWQKRNKQAIRRNTDLARREHEDLMELLATRGDARIRAHLDELRTSLLRDLPDYTDDWALCEIERVEEVRDLFIPHFYFGCEADDPVTPWAFNERANPLGVRLRACLGSDLGHWDVNDMREIVEEAYENVERGLMTDEEFRAFTCTHPMQFFAGANPGFFEGTRVETPAAP
jgi:predicted TIM-barrel fold metal-dependent hydrolase